MDSKKNPTPDNHFIRTWATERETPRVSYQDFLTWDIYVSFLMVCFIQLILIFEHVHILGTEKACFE